jgi:hypothetical protein
LGLQIAFLTSFGVNPLGQGCGEGKALYIGQLVYSDNKGFCRLLTGYTLGALIILDKNITFINLRSVHKTLLHAPRQA